MFIPGTLMTTYSVAPVADTVYIHPDPYYRTNATAGSSCHRIALQTAKKPKTHEERSSWSWEHVRLVEGKLEGRARFHYMNRG